MGYLESNELIGHDASRVFLARALKNKRHHAFLFYGAEHLGKDTVARAMVADELNRPVHAWEDLANQPDVRVLERAEGEKNIGIADLRAFISHFSSSSFLGGRKIGVIRGAHEMSMEAANALLKTLEEPMGKALLILTAHSLERLPDTVKSRCQPVRFLAVPVREIAAGLERRGLDRKAAAVSAAFAAGRPGIAVNHAEDDGLRAASAEKARMFIRILESPLSARMSAAADIAAKAETPELASTLDVWTSVLHDALSAKTGNERYASDQSSLPALRRYAASVTAAGLVASHRRLSSGKRMLSENVNPRLIFENIVLAL